MSKTLSATPSRAPEPRTSAPSRYSRRTGGHYVRARVTDPTTDKLVSIKKTLQTKHPLEAFQWLQGEIDRIRSGTLLPQRAKPRFSECAALLLEEKLARLRELYPQFYAMAYLGFATGLRPSSLRPLRRRGPEADVLWDRNRILIRRSQTRGQEVMNMTKQRTRYAIDLPKAVVDVLKWHVEQMLWRSHQQDSDLLFPSTTGSFRAPTVLNPAFAEIAAELGFPKFTQRGMRRTYNDLARAAGVLDLVTRSISGHATETMQHHYSTVSADEQRASIGKVIQLFGAGGPSAQAGGPLSDSGGPLNEKTGREDSRTG